MRATPDELRSRYLAEGLWIDQSLGQYLDARITRSADKTLRFWSEQRPWQGTIGEAQALGQQIAGGLREMGVGQGDVVAFQLPNCPEAIATFFAVSRLGATIVPIVHFYGPKEVRYILGESGAKVLITADAFGWLDYRTSLEEIRPELPDLEEVVFVPMGEPAPNLGALAGATPLDELPDVDPDAAALIAYTSGTTADPKGVIHTHRSIVAEATQLGDRQPAGQLPMLNGAPLGHAIGMLGGILLPLYMGKEMHLIDVWNPQVILDAMLEANIYSGSGATYFLLSLLDHPAITPDHLAKMRYVGLGGASVPLAVGERATDLGISLIRAYGSTEHPSTTGASHDEPLAKRIGTDGRPLLGVELRIVDDEGNDRPRGEPGEIWSRGPDLCAGYTDAALTAENFTDDGWYRSGDVGIFDDDGWLTITDRIRDIIIRGGETISPVEIEDLLIRMPEVAEVAVVAAPDERMGEHGCAFIRVAPDHEAPDLATLRAHLQEAGLARQKWPEEIREVEDFPRTPSGKVKKFELRDQLR